MDVKDLHKQLGQMIDNGKGDFEVVHVMGNGTERAFCGFEVDEQGFFTVRHETDKRAQLADAVGKSLRERPRLRLFTHSPF